MTTGRILPVDIAGPAVRPGGRAARFRGARNPPRLRRRLRGDDRGHERRQKAGCHRDQRHAARLVRESVVDAAHRARRADAEGQRRARAAGHRRRRAARRGARGGVESARHERRRHAALGASARARGAQGRRVISAHAAGITLDVDRHRVGADAASHQVGERRRTRPARTDCRAAARTRHESARVERSRRAAARLQHSAEGRERFQVAGGSRRRHASHPAQLRGRAMGRRRAGRSDHVEPGRRPSAAARRGRGRQVDAHEARRRRARRNQAGARGRTADDRDGRAVARQFGRAVSGARARRGGASSSAGRCGRGA